MHDFTHLVNRSEYSQVFIGNRSTVGALTQTWVKPRRISMVYILALGQGGDGLGATLGVTSAGGVGGASGAQSTLLIPASFLPDILYIGGGNSGISAIATIVAARPCGATYNSIPQARDTFLIAGGASYDAAGAIGTTATALLSNRGIVSFLVGRQGASGGTTSGTTGGAASAGTGLIVSAGGGGGGMSATVAGNGGAGGITGPTQFVVAPGGAAGTSGIDGVYGSNGYSDMSSLVFAGGSGAGAGYPLAVTSNAGHGAAGGFGCGGGGGGGGLLGTVVSRGGKGGAGLVIITCW